TISKRDWSSDVCSSDLHTVVQTICHIWEFILAAETLSMQDLLVEYKSLMLVILTGANISIVISVSTNVKTKTPMFIQHGRLLLCLKLLLFIKIGRASCSESV